MTIKKFLGKTEEEAKEKAKAELGEKAIIMSVRAVKPKGLAGLFKGVSFEVTAAIEDQESKNQKTFEVEQNRPEKINLAADEKIVLPPQRKKENQPQDQAEKVATTLEKIQPMLNKVSQNASTETKSSQLEEKSEISALEMYKKKNTEKEQFQNRLNQVHEKLMEKEQALEPKKEKIARDSETLRMMKMVYKILLENEVDEKYANQILDEMDGVFRSSSSMDVMLSNIYQKIILKFGQNDGILLDGKRPKIYFFVGPTGVGKTTTIAKVASKLKVEGGKKVAFLTADTYRIAAAEQLRTYANILDAPLKIVYTASEINEALEELEQYDVVLVDTAGFSHKSKEQKDDVRRLISNVDEKYDKKTFLVLSATTKYMDLLDIADSYAQICDFDLIFTKLDETSHLGNLLNLCLYTKSHISFVTNGQNVPEDIEKFNSQKIVKQLLGGKESWTKQKDSEI